MFPVSSTAEVKLLDASITLAASLIVFICPCNNSSASTELGSSTRVMGSEKVMGSGLKVMK